MLKSLGPAINCVRQELTLMEGNRPEVLVSVAGAADWVDRSSVSVVLDRPHDTRSGSEAGSACCLESAFSDEYSHGVIPHTFCQAGWVSLDSDVTGNSLIGIPECSERP